MQLSFGEGQNSQGYFTLALQLKNERDACLYRPGLGQVSCLCFQFDAMPYTSLAMQICMQPIGRLRVAIQVNKGHQNGPLHHSKPAQYLLSCKAHSVYERRWTGWVQLETISDSGSLLF